LCAALEDMEDAKEKLLDSRRREEEVINFERNLQSFFSSWLAEMP
jgi:hypothetical protein